MGRFPHGRYGLVGVLLWALLLPAFVHAQTGGPGYWFDAWRGWHFYEDPAPEVPAAPPPPSAPRSSAAPRARAKAPEVVELEQLRKDVEERRLIAVMRPTETNVRRYMELESKVVAQASRFADVAQRVAWSTPELDPTLQGRPVNALALDVFEKQQMSSRSNSIAHLGRDHVLIFVFRSDCPYCHAMAPVLDAFRSRHGMQIVAVSVDGGVLPGFPDARRDNGIATTLRVSQVPAVFLAQPFTGRITPIGFGVLSESQLMERISLLGGSSGEEVPLIPLNGGSSAITPDISAARLR